MITSITAGKIFLADQRGLQSTAMLTRWSTFNFGRFVNPNKTPIARLYLLNDERLAPGAKTCFEIERDSYLVLLPITGTLNYLDDAENETDIAVEESMVVFVTKGTNVTLSNAFDHHIIDYMVIGLIADEVLPDYPQYFNFDLGNRNKLTTLVNQALPFKISIGIFDGRREFNYRLSKANKIFAFVITGVFEINGRLLHGKDGLALWDTPFMEGEALSNDAVVFMIELHTSDEVQSDDDKS